MTLRTVLSAVPKKWKMPRVMLGLMTLELLLSVAALALFGIAQPDLYRTRFWKEGSIHGWNSNPNQLVYAYANYRPIKAPLPWSQFVTNYNVIISVLVVFLLLCKGIMWIMAIFYPLISILLHAALTALFAVSIHAQAAPDMSDPKHPQPGAPWYLTKSCGPPVSHKLLGYCKQAKAAFAVTVLLCTLYVVYMIFALISLYPSKAFRSARNSKSLTVESGRQPWEMLEVPNTPRTPGALRSPTTPRTFAFNTLSGNKKLNVGNGKQQPVRQGNQGLPLRHHIGMGDEIYSGPDEKQGQ